VTFARRKHRRVIRRWWGGSGWGNWVTIAPAVFFLLPKAAGMSITQPLMQNNEHSTNSADASSATLASAAPDKSPASAGNEPCELSIIVPAYNEEARLGKSLPVILEYLRQQPYTWELLVVNDGSRDRTEQVARECCGHQVRVITNSPNRGKGYSIRRGMLEARGKWRLFSDADLSTPISELDKFWPFTRQGYDVVIGSRALPDSDLEVRQPRSRELIGRVFNTIVQTFLVPGLADTQCGYKLFSAAAAEAVFSRQTLHGFAFDVEILVLAHRLGYRIKEVPVRWINDPGSKVSTLNGVKGFVDLGRLCLRRFGRENSQSRPRE